MTQRIFDILNEKDYADLWDILPDDYCRIEKRGRAYCFYKTTCAIDHYESFANFFKIDWHDKTEITRPIQDATEADIGKLCCFGDVEPNKKFVGRLSCIDSESVYCKYMMCGGDWFGHCRRLTKQEIEELI